jgi:hypothetical protein
MKHDLGMNIITHWVFFGKTGVTRRHETGTGKERNRMNRFVCNQWQVGNFVTQK